MGINAVASSWGSNERGTQDILILLPPVIRTSLQFLPPESLYFLFSFSSRTLCLRHLRYPISEGSAPPERVDCPGKYVMHYQCTSRMKLGWRRSEVST